MIIKILSEQDFLDSLYDWKFTDEAKKALYKYYNNTESNFIFNSTQILNEWDEYETTDLVIDANQFTLEDYGRKGCILVKSF